MDITNLKAFLDSKVLEYNRPGFIKHDPVSIPHQFSKKQDIEIAGLFAAVFAWGQRKTIINKCQQLMELMDFSPHDFIIGHKENDLKRFLNFKHRTFNSTDTLYFIYFLKHFFERYDSLEDAFLTGTVPATGVDIESALVGFHELFFSLLEAPERTRKHIPTPARKSACKRINMYLRWMVREDNMGVDFGIWKRIKPYQLVCPCDIHVSRVARRLGLIKRKQTDWLAAIELTGNLRIFEPEDPVKYDFALFGLGVEEKII